MSKVSMKTKGIAVKKRENAKVSGVKNKSRAGEKVGNRVGAKESSEPIVIDAARGWIFQNETELYEHFSESVHTIEALYAKRRASDDIADADLVKYESLLHQVLEEPDEVWMDSELLKDQVVHSYIGQFEVDTETVFYIANTYVVNESPAFIYLHFATRDPKLVDKYRQGQLVYDRVIKEVEAGAIDGDVLGEGDPLAVGLYKAMLKLRNPSDIPESEFRNFSDKREESIEQPDEIWRTNDLSGNILVSFISDFSSDTDALYYVVVTVEDAPSGSHAILFSFPTNDVSLVERYRHGENLQAEEVVQEASH